MASSSLNQPRPVYGAPGALPAAAPTRGTDDAPAAGTAAPVIEPEVARPQRASADGPAPAIVVVGAASRDLDDGDPRGWRLGGGATYGALVLARLGLRVGVVLGVDAAAAAAHELDLLREAGAEIHPVRLPRGPVFQLAYTPAGRTVRCEDPGGPLPVAALPPAWRAAPAWYLAPVADELPDGWAAIPPGAVVALGWQGLLRDLERGSPVRPRAPGPRALLRRADLVSVSVEDLDPAIDLRGLLRFLRAGTLCTLTRGPHGGVAFTVRPGTPRMRILSRAAERRRGRHDGSRRRVPGRAARRPDGAGAGGPPAAPARGPQVRRRRRGGPRGRHGP